MQRPHSTSGMRLLAAIAQGLVLLFGACGGHETRGTTFDFRSDVQVYLGVGEISYRPLSQQELDAVLKTATWTIPSGVEILEKGASAAPTSVSWQRGSTQYTVQGATVSFRGRGRILPDCPEGEHDIGVDIPGFLLLSEATQTSPMVIDGLYPATGYSLRIHTVRVHATTAGTFWASVGRVARIVGVLILILILVAWLGQYAG